MASKTFLGLMADNGGSIPAGWNADLDDERAAECETAIRLGWVDIRRDGWATGDHYVLTLEGWRAAGRTPPPSFLPEPTLVDHLAAGFQITVAAGIFVLLVEGLRMAWNLLT